MATTGTASDTREPETTPAFGATFADRMGVAEFTGGGWSGARLDPVAPLSLHPAAHVLHYGSACFEGLKAHRGVDGAVRIFRLDRHVARMQRSAEVLVLPVPPADLLTELVTATVRDALNLVPEAPGSLYLRPTLIGVDPNIGSAARPSDDALLFVLASPVGDYFAGGVRALVVAVSHQPRTTPQFGVVKSGANYAMALGTTRRAGREVGADQVLFAPGGRVEETGASNFVLVDGERLVTPALTDSFLHGVTRDSLLRVAADLGYDVEERTVTVDELVDWARRPDAEAALSGTAAALSPVGQLVIDGERIDVGTGGVGGNVVRLRDALREIQTAARPDPDRWLTEVRA
ncbi:MAG TPA: branched-chain amino acid aminotransferase [Acidimicrobiales bacterium]